MSKSGRGEARVDLAGRVRPKAGAVQQSANAVARHRSGGDPCVGAWPSAGDATCCAWRPTSLLFPADLGSSSTVGLSPVSSRGPRPRTGAEVSPTHESCWRMRLEPSTRHLSLSRQERGLDNSDPGLIATYRRYRRLRQEFAERSLVAPQFSCLGDLAGAVWKYQDVVHVQDLSAALGGAAKQRNRVVVVSQDMVEFHSIVPSKARTLWQ